MKKRENNSSIRLVLYLISLIIYYYKDNLLSISATANINILGINEHRKVIKKD